ncbi:hypothetical protein Ahy_A02g009356 [Arachis hypogaea]|uniref:Uncharacterized protein n=1 Tax=Arachis hypogaea TaxID=3818 RepID=A0A445EGU6_ARAHY|nr:hypothetical protein Ahy_A02g009356 [Arachis hypogaea]
MLVPPPSLGNQHSCRLFVFAGLSNPFMENSINQEATADNNASVNNNISVDPPISNDDDANPNSHSANDSQSQGGIHMMKKHLAKITGDVKKCPKVPYDMEKQMESLLKEIQTNKKKIKGGNEDEDHPTEADLQQVLADFND